MVDGALAEVDEGAVVEVDVVLLGRGAGGGVKTSSARSSRTGGSVTSSAWSTWLLQGRT